MRSYPGPSSRGPLPLPPPPQPVRSPHDHHSVMGPYPGAGLPQPGMPPSSQGAPPIQQLQQQQQQLPRVSNPNYAGPGGPSSIHSAQNGINAPASSKQLPPFGRTNSPRTDGRSLHDSRMSSPKSIYPHQSHYSHHSEMSYSGGMDNGAPVPISALTGTEPTTNDRNGDPRPSSVGPKRLREWEDDQPSMKKPASDENRARLMDSHHRRPSTPPRESSFRRSSSEICRTEDQRHLEDQRRVEEQRRDDQRRIDDQRRSNESYHPSEAAHHPTMAPNSHLPLLQQGQSLSRTPAHEILPPPPPAAPKDYSSEERERDRVDHLASLSHTVSEPERAKRKLEVDEDYDDDGDDEKKLGLLTVGPGSVSTSGDVKSTPPSGVNGHGVNNVSNVQPKLET